MNNSNNSQKYIIANIKIPIEILDNGEQITYMNNISVDFTTSNVLPPLQNIENIDNIEYVEDIYKIFNSSRQQTNTSSLN